jgi:hypothetical protein
VYSVAASKLTTKQPAPCQLSKKKGDTSPQPIMSASGQLRKAFGNDLAIHKPLQNEFNFSLKVLSSEN